MANDRQTRGYHCLMGALVADAAALGFHWLYDQSRIREIAPQQPEFHPINQDDYSDVPGYFAHAARSTGDLSQYGEQLWTLMKSLADSDGVLSTSHYEQTFRDHFGYGGRYVGYIDRPTRDTLDNITSEETALLKKANAIDFSGSQQDRNALMSKVRSYSQSLQGDALRERVKTAVKVTHDAPAMIEHAFELCDLIEQTSEIHGADDQQLPAVAKIPAIAAVSTGAENYVALVEQAVRVTNNNDTAVDYATAIAKLLSAIMQGATVEQAMVASLEAASPTVKLAYDKARDAAELPVSDAVKQFGMACDLDYAVPSILHILNSSSTYEEAIRANIYAGGDSCGRAIIVGAASAMLFADDKNAGIPSHWLSQLSAHDALAKLSRQLTG